jgi:hypothetical protein
MEWTERKVTEIDTRIAADLNGHSGYRNTLMATERKEMNECWNLDPIRERFYKLL